MMKTLLPFLVLPFLCGSCFVSRDRVNEPLPAAVVTELEPGVATADDVLDALGAPADVVQLGRRSAWLYLFNQTKSAAFSVLVVTLVNTDTRSDRVWVFFDEAGLLTHVGGSFEGATAAYTMPWDAAE
ncbi:MAG: outer membrane protein assembly factor BamE [Planctomycetota bacterium]|jgi:outer membrane protein assembly factor BamE (lipoprotein component of BamABCDE complex)|nr:outer membrane protein assembly factor BamE [Planctomycetota bacterium]MDP6763641.1 outer membrane protein assembly factor BamE [Planctomycetota bacterium]